MKQIVYWKLKIKKKLFLGLFNSSDMNKRLEIKGTKFYGSGISSIDIT